MTKQIIDISEAFLSFIVMKALFFKRSLVVLGAMVFTASAQAQDDETPMTKEMSATSKALKSLRKIDLNDWDALAKAARDAHTAFLKSMPEVATMVKEMKDGPEKEKALADSRRLMGLCYAALCELELAYLAKDKAKVAAVMSKIKEVKKEGHEKYTDD